MSYKKRAKAGWCTSKKECKEKIYKERQYEKKEVKQALEEMDAGDDYRYPHYKASPNPEKKLEGRIKSIEQNINMWTRRKESANYEYWANNHLNWLKSWLNSTKDKLKKLKDKKEQKM